MSHDYLGFEGTIDEEDYGIIVSPDGTLKGIYIPGDAVDEDIPTAVVQIFKEKWGVDPNDETVYGYLH